MPDSLDSFANGDILIARDGPIATLTINRPAKRNALARATWIGLTEAMAALSADDVLRAVILRGAGEEAFASGNDISGFREERATPEQVRDYTTIMHGGIEAVHICRHPTVALIHGFCLGGGLEIASACDIRIAGQSARFGIPSKNMGLYLGYALLESMIALCGRAVTLEMLLEGRLLDADTAFAKGLVTRIVADDAVEDEAHAAARRIAEGAPLAARWHKQAVRRLALPQPLTDEEKESQYGYADSEDYRIGYQAFLDKKRPAFKAK